MNIILLGPPGAGKGTQAQSPWSKTATWFQLSTGDMLREAKDSGTEMGKIVAEVMDSGNLVTDEIVIGLIREKLQGDKQGGFIFDGFPRTLAQADALATRFADEEQGETRRLDGMCRRGWKSMTRFWSRRIVGRFQAEALQMPQAGTARADDNEESLKIRLMEYYKKTSPLIGYYDTPRAS